MYMGVILVRIIRIKSRFSAPHVYGGDPNPFGSRRGNGACSPCIWG